MEVTWGLSLGTVWAPQSQRHRMVLAPHSGQTRSPTEVFTAPAFFRENVLPFSSLFSDWAERATVSMKRWAPPALPTGNRAWGGGLSSLSLAFSGRAILVPMRVTALALTVTPIAWETASRVGLAGQLRSCHHHVPLDAKPQSGQERRRILGQDDVVAVDRMQGAQVLHGAFRCRLDPDGQGAVDPSAFLQQVFPQR